MNWTDANPSDVKTIHMRHEGDVNSYWDVVLKDNTKMKFYGYESGPHYEDGPKADASLWDDNPKLYEFLCDINLQIPEFDPSEDAVDYDLSFNHTSKHIMVRMSDVVIQKNDGGNWDKYVKVEGIFDYTLK